MSDASQPSDPQQHPARFWKWTERGCGCLLLGVLLSCGLMCGVGWFVWDHFSGLRASVDQVHREALAGGDVDAIYETADARFREQYTKKHLTDFASGHADLFVRDNLSGRKVETLTVDGEAFVVLLVTVARRLGRSEVGIYCRVAADGKLHLLGIWPNLEAAVPAVLQKVLARMTRESHDWDD